MKRGLLVIALGVGFLVLVTGLGTFITNYMPAMQTPASQTTQAGPYTITLRVDPNPPSTSQPATCTIQVQQGSSSIDGAQVTLEGQQADMGLSTSAISASPRGHGQYVARVSFSMNGSWQMQVIITLPNQLPLHAAFAVTAQ
jgi:hypothetical protein